MSNRRQLVRPASAGPARSARLVPAWPVALEPSVILAAPFALAVSATLLTAAGWLPRAPSPYLGWSSVAVVAVAWTLPSLAARVVEQIIVLRLVPVGVQAARCGFGRCNLSTERYLLRHALPGTVSLGLVTAQVMAGRPFWSLDPAMWVWAIPGVLAGSAGVYACAESRRPETG